MPTYSTITFQTNVTSFPWILLPCDNGIPVRSFGITMTKVRVSGIGETAIRLEATLDDPSNIVDFHAVMALTTGQQPPQVSAVNIRARAIRPRCTVVSVTPCDYTVGILAI